MAADGERLLRSAEVAEILGVGPKTISRWAQEGLLPFVWTRPWLPDGQKGHRRYLEREIRALVGQLPAAPES